MTILKYALTGTHGSGKTYIAEQIDKRARGAGMVVATFHSPTRYLKKLFDLGNNRDGDWEFQIRLITEFQRQAREAERDVHHLMQLEPPRQLGLIIGDRCSLDPLAYAEDLLAQVAPSGTDVLVESREVQLLRQVVAITRELAYADRFWDVIAYKPPHPDFLTADADRLDDRDYQRAIDLLIAGHVQRFCGVQPDQKVEYLHIDRDRAVDELWEIIQHDAAQRRAA
ncbi:thymidylate kinase [Mycobacterium phage Colt]|uniref:Thymidylate kinase n=1 Tax=Mycobacterium phage Cane17 TaxID=2301548 RepID=A0A346N8Y6_9CAUD|nr:thymidylate kinase [Mycobacterium phage Cane17]AXQ51771.1 thymidylate kinase [Mycobacterium phage Cane17]QAY14105.1 thymidylate kinase [Mycobacterium phage Colt]